MENQSYNIKNGILTNPVIPKPIQKLLDEFTQKCRPLENTIYVFTDAKTNAYYCECHLSAKDLLKLSTTDVPLDPDEQAQGTDFITSQDVTLLPYLLSQEKSLIPNPFTSSTS